ncbi:MAG: DNA translocase FtsK, partial [Phycisphaerae bacterium]
RLEVQVVAVETGPVITVFELRLSPGIKVSQITSLQNDLARAMKAPSVRVVAPLPGKNTIGIEVPNIDKEKVRLRELIHAAASRSETQALPMYLGKDASGQALVTDLARMPHLLIAGTTGSGKSVCVSSLVMSLLLARTPSEVQLILVDPKVVELAMFKDVPHLMCPIVTDPTKAASILDWAATKMDERYALLAEAGVKEIRAYNKLGVAGLRERLQPSSDEELAKIPVHLPYIVIIIDELADLMMTSAKEVEFFLCRLAQKSRAVGIHLIVSTQRPQANVVTGLIKSNLPCRVAFRVASRLDSRIVLDQNGAELLMGQGDMLFLPPGSAKLMRAQGTFIADDELRRVVQHCKQQAEPQFHPELVRMPGGGDAASTERDELFDSAVDIVIETQRGSVSLLQRRLTIGYGRASRLIDQMYAAGLVGEYKGSQAREVVVTKEEWQAIRAQRDREVSAEESETANG